MKSMQSTIQEMIKENKNMMEIQEAVKKNLLDDPSIKSFLDKHPNISNATIDKRLNKLYEFKTQSIQCDKCDSLESCSNIVKGLSPILHEVDNDIQVSYEKCRHQLEHERNKENEALINGVHIPEEILNAQMDKLYIDASRATAINEIDKFLEEAANGLPRKGIYFTGPFGVGKTYLLGAIANQLRKLDIASTLIYMPEFVRSTYASIKTDNVNEKIKLFKETDVLMIDDIGAENLSAWFRDEVLGAILQDRMMEGKPVFFTSNYTMDQLEQVLSRTSKGDVEEVKAGRIMERIKQLSHQVVMDGKNYRNEKK